jgi:hypothetical protein
MQLIPAQFQIWLTIGFFTAFIWIPVVFCSVSCMIFQDLTSVLDHLVFSFRAGYFQCFCGLCGICTISVAAYWSFFPGEVVGQDLFYAFWPEDLLRGPEAHWRSRRDHQQVVLSIFVLSTPEFAKVVSVGLHLRAFPGHANLRIPFFPVYCWNSFVFFFSHIFQFVLLCIKYVVPPFSYSSESYGAF